MQNLERSRNTRHRSAVEVISGATLVLALIAGVALVIAHMAGG